jgi:hypothetical protein
MTHGALARALEIVVWQRLRGSLAHRFVGGAFLYFFLTKIELCMSPVTIGYIRKMISHIG